MTGNLAAIILAAGQGTRMQSPLAKVLHPVAGKPMIAWSVQAALDAGADDVVVVVGHGRQQVQALLAERFSGVRTVVQEEQRGTGHAVMCALPEIGDAAAVLITYGDCPLIPGALLSKLARQRESDTASLSLVTAKLTDPTGYGRVVRAQDGAITAIVEERDCDDAQRGIDEINPGIYCATPAFLDSALQKLTPHNAQGELYLTDIVGLAAEQATVASITGSMTVLSGVNDRFDLSQATARAHRQIAEAHGRAGVGMTDATRVYIDADCQIEPNAFVEVDAHVRGRSVVKKDSVVGVGCVLTDVIVEAGARLLPYTVATESVIGQDAQVGPFSHLRPNTTLGDGTKVGNFSETKNTTLGAGSKVNHLAYVGDGQIGDRVNIGAGTIFCNYDGERKHTTVVEDDVFIGSDSQLIAPVKIGKGAYVASGTTVTRDVPDNALAVARTKQSNKEGYASRLRARFKKKKP